jgi:hypothetical protein
LNKGITVPILVLECISSTRYGYQEDAVSVEFTAQTCVANVSISDVQNDAVVSIYGNNCLDYTE